MPTGTPATTSNNSSLAPVSKIPTSIPNYQSTTYNDDELYDTAEDAPIIIHTERDRHNKPNGDYSEVEEIEESLSLEDMEQQLIKKALDKHRGRRTEAAKELGISERTLYRKIRQYEIEA